MVQYTGCYTIKEHFYCDVCFTTSMKNSVIYIPCTFNISNSVTRGHSNLVYLNLENFNILCYL